MNMLGHRLGIVCAAILSAHALAQSNGAAPLVAPPANGLVRAPIYKSANRVALPERPESLVLQAISSIGNEPVALLSVKRPRPRPTAIEFGREIGLWLAAGDSSYGYTVKAIATDHVILVRRDTREFTIPLASAPITASDAKPYSKAWINSPANPMLNDAQPMPGRMYSGNWDPLTGNTDWMNGRDWDQLAGKKKKQVVEFYRKHGWQLIPTKADLGPTQFKWRNLYEAERAAAIEANREKFAQSLTPEQLGLWKQMRGFQSIYFPGGPTKEQRELIAARQRIIDEFKNSLTAEQKAEQKGIEDFTKASWK